MEGRAFELGDFIVRVGSIMIRQHAVRQVELVCILDA